MSTKYQYEDPFMQKVAELCDRGFWPVCVDKDGHYAIFTPLQDGAGCFRRGVWDVTIENSENRLGVTSHKNSDLQPVDFARDEDGNPIFYHPPIPQFKIGDKVKVKKDLEEASYALETLGRTGVVAEILSHGVVVVVELDSNSWHYLPSQLEPVIEPEPVKEMTVAEVEEALGYQVKIIK